MSIACLVIPVVLFADSDTAYDSALQCYSSGKYKEAVKYLADYVQKKPDPAAYYLLGYSLYELRRFAEADEYFRQAYLIDPTFSPEKIGVSKKYPPPKTKAAKKHPKKHKHAARRKAGSSGSKGGEQAKQGLTPEKQTGRDIQQKQPAAQEGSPKKTPPPAAKSEPKKAEQQE
jgi:tetratricopeptide (TPR) repeat protein